MFTSFILKCVYITMPTIAIAIPRTFIVLASAPKMRKLCNQSKAKPRNDTVKDPTHPLHQQPLTVLTWT